MRLLHVLLGLWAVSTTTASRRIRAAERPVDVAAPRADGAAELDVAAPRADGASEGDHAPLSNRMRRGGSADVIKATVLSCGLGGFHCGSGGSPACHMKLCRRNFDNECCVITLACCALPTGGCWCRWAKNVHRHYNVDYYNAGWA